MWCFRHFGGQINTSFQTKVFTQLPQRAIGYVVDFAFVGSVGFATIFAVELRKFISGKYFALCKDGTTQ